MLGGVPEYPSARGLGVGFEPPKSVDSDVQKLCHPFYALIPKSLRVQSLGPDIPGPEHERNDRHPRVRHVLQAGIAPLRYHLKRLNPYFEATV